AILECDTCASAGEATDDVGDQHLPGRGQPADPRGDVHRATVDVALLADDVAGVEAEVKRETAVVAGIHAGECGLDRLTAAREDREHAVAEELAFDRGAAVVTDDSAEGAVQLAGLRAESAVAEALGDSSGVGDVGEEDDGGAGGSLWALRASAYDGRWSKAQEVGEEFADRCQSLRTEQQY